MSNRGYCYFTHCIYDDNPSHLMLVHIFDDSMEQAEGVATNSISISKKTTQFCHLLVSTHGYSIDGCPLYV